MTQILVGSVGAYVSEERMMQTKFPKVTEDLLFNISFLSIQNFCTILI